MSGPTDSYDQTPGPWYVELGELGEERWVDGIYAHGVLRVVETDAGAYPPYWKDAHLIAAAPEMYEALRLIRETLALESWAYNRGDESMSIAEKVDAALKKARGE